jgi:hypothetical protein
MQEQQNQPSDRAGTSFRRHCSEGPEGDSESTLFSIAPSTLGARPIDTNGAALKRTDLVAFRLAPAAFTLDETLPAYSFAIRQARRAITGIYVVIGHFALALRPRRITSRNLPSSEIIMTTIRVLVAHLDELDRHFQWVAFWTRYDDAGRQRPPSRRLAADQHHAARWREDLKAATARSLNVVGPVSILAEVQALLSISPR